MIAVRFIYNWDNRDCCLDPYLAVQILNLVFFLNKTKLYWNGISILVLDELIHKKSMVCSLICHSIH